MRDHTSNSGKSLAYVAAVVLICTLNPAFAGKIERASNFLRAKTIFQTNCAYDARIAIAADGVIVHRHGIPFEQAVESWRQHGFAVGRMFFADSDAANVYWTGKWDGTPHPEDVERDRTGQVVKCAGVRPYMLPTEGWIRYLEEMTDKSLEAGANAILPEEPLAHVFTGYEKSFRRLWKDRYKEPWQPQDASAAARFLTAQLKNELYLKLEERLLRRTKQFGRAAHKDTAFVLPIHSLYSNIAAQLVAPLGTSANLPGVDGYIGQIWTGPVNWALGCYDSPRKSFFASAYVLYDYFTQLTVQSDKKLWLLVDPVEDNPAHKWSEFAEWYKHCIVAMLLMDDVDSYEIMPWPDRIFLPGYGTGGGTPAPEDYRTTILAVTQVLQEIPAGGTWIRDTGSGGPKGATARGRIGVAVSDTLMWQPLKQPRLQGVYSMLSPLVERGIPVSSFILERVEDQAYLSRFKVIVLSYESFKPVRGSMNAALARWVRGGGVLIVLGKDGDELDRCEDFWWHQAGFKSPLCHLLAQLGSRGKPNASWKLGAGYVFRNDISPTEFANPTVADKIYLPLLDAARRKAGQSTIATPGSFMRRGPFIIAHAEGDSIRLSGRFIDVFDPNLSLCDAIQLAPGQSGLYRDVANEMNESRPALLHTTHRLTSQEYKNGVLRFSISGPAGTPAVARAYLPGSRHPQVTAAGSNGEPVEITMQIQGDTLFLRFPNNPSGVTVEIQ
jgi:hypothetical protein